MGIAVFTIYLAWYKIQFLHPLIRTKASAFITSPVSSFFITPSITPFQNTFALFIRSTLDIFLFIDAYLQFQLWRHDMNNLL